MISDGCLFLALVLFLCLPIFGLNGHENVVRKLQGLGGIVLGIEPGSPLYKCRLFRLPKAEAVTIPTDIAEALKSHPDTPQGRRDALLMCLLIDHGLRVGEVAILTVKAFDLKAGTMIFYRPKVDKVQTHTMTPDTRNAARAYLRLASQEGILWRKSNKGTDNLGGQMSERSATRAINKRVELLGRHAGIEGLSPHDCRHYAATYEARKGTPVDRLVDMFGWNSPTMAFRYIEAAQIANEGTARVKKT